MAIHFFCAVMVRARPLTLSRCTIQISQASSPACTELEIVVMNWLGQMVGLPEDFLHLRADSPGGGVIQVSLNFYHASYS